MSLNAKNLVATLCMTGLLGGSGGAAQAKTSLLDVLGFPLRWLGGNLVGGGVDRLKGAADALIENVDRRLVGHEVRIAGLAGELVADAKVKVDDSLARIDRGLEARILQAKLSAAELIDQMDLSLTARLEQAGRIGTRVVADADRALKTNLERVDTILRERSGDLDQKANGLLQHADQVIASRIEQIDEAVGRRLGDVDVIASKQRIALERSAIRLAVLLGLVGFVVLVLYRMWEEHGNLARGELSGLRGLDRTLLITRRFTPLLGGSIVAAACGAAVLLVLYRWLPLDAEKEARALVDIHRRGLETSVAGFDYTTARFHASQLDFLEPEAGPRHTALADKAGLLRDLAMRPTLLATRKGVDEFTARVRDVARRLGRGSDPDLLVLQAVIAWEAGPTRADEHEAATLAARALRIAPRGFALAPLARAYVQTFLHAPYLDDHDTGQRDAASLAELEAAVAPDARGEPPGSPLAATIVLGRLMRQLERCSTGSYIDMIRTHAEIVALGLQPKSRGRDDKLRRLKALRTAYAANVYNAWVAFDAELRATGGLDGPPVLAIFRLNDAVLSRALWFLKQPNTVEIGAALAALPETTKGLKLRIALAPARVTWARRYATLFRGPAKEIAEFEETERFRTWERWTIEFEEAMVKLTVAKQTHVHEQESRARLAIAAAVLALYVDRQDGRRVPYASTLTPDDASPAIDVTQATKTGPHHTLAEAMRQRGPRLI